jgi:hypothetical protein
MSQDIGIPLKPHWIRGFFGWAFWGAGGLVVAGGVEDQIAEQFARGGFDDSDAEVADDAGSAWVRPTPMWCRRPAMRNVTEPASSARSVRTRSWVSVRGWGLLWVGPGRPWRGSLGGAARGQDEARAGLGGAQRCGRHPGHDHPARRVLASASRPLPGFGIHESDGAPDEKEGRPKHESPGYQACMMAR